jgi:hypothetical protein
MIEIIMKFFENNKKKTAKIHDLTICVKEREVFLSL